MLCMYMYLLHFILIDTFCYVHVVYIVTGLYIEMYCLEVHVLLIVETIFS